MSLTSFNADRYGVTYAWGGINSAYNQFGAVGHTGFDCGAWYQPIYAEFPGTVVGNLWGNGYGNYVKIKDVDGDVWLYCHLSDFSLSVGDEVMRGQQVGISGASGYVTGPHCHIECFPAWGGNPDYYGTVDPIWYLSLETRFIPEYGHVDPPPVEPLPEPVEPTHPVPTPPVTPDPPVIIPEPLPEPLPPVEPPIDPPVEPPIIPEKPLWLRFLEWLLKLIKRS